MVAGIFTRPAPANAATTARTFLYLLFTNKVAGQGKSFVGVLFNTIHCATELKYAVLRIIPHVHCTQFNRK